MEWAAVVRTCNKQKIDGWVAYVGSSTERLHCSLDKEKSVLTDGCQLLDWFEVREGGQESEKRGMLRLVIKRK